MNSVTDHARFIKNGEEALTYTMDDPRLIEIVKKLLPNPDWFGLINAEEWKEIHRLFQAIAENRRKDRLRIRDIDHLALQAEKAASFDRMVLALDAIQVGTKLLGDCTGADLLREAVKLEEMAKEATAQSVFYRQLAAIVGKTTTVRTANDRAGILGLLTDRYQEAA